MLFNNEKRMRPAFATAGADVHTASNPRNQREGFMADTAADTDEFGAFRDEPARAPRTRRSAPEGGARRSFFNRKTIIAIAAAAAALLLILLVVLLVANSSSDLRYTDNTYIAYMDNTGNYRVAVNGTEMDEIFVGTTKVVPSLDRSFAYVETEDEEGNILIYLLRNNKLTELVGTESAVTEVLSYAQITPGVVYAEDNDVFLYNEEIAMGRVTELIDVDVSELTFLISDDASTVVYTLPKDNSAAETSLWCYRNLRSDPLRINNHTPVALSADGTYLYTVSNSARKLYWVNTTDVEKNDIICDGNFGGITAINVKGTEILYYTNPTDAKMAAAVYSIPKDTNYEIAKGKGVFFPAKVDAKVARYDSFANMYFESYNTSETLGTSQIPAGHTYYLNGNYESKIVASAIGKFSPNGKYFYYISSTKEMLYQIELSKLNDKEGASPSPLQSLGTVANFEITAKNNLYVQTKDDDLWFFEPSTGKSQRIVRGILLDMSMHSYANKLYYTVEDQDIVYVTEEGSKGAAAQLDKIQPTALPVFINPDSQKTFLYFYDDESGYSLLYTSNGSSFKTATSECAEIVQDDAMSWEDILEDLLDKLGSNVGNNNTNNNTSNNGTGNGAVG